MLTQNVRKYRPGSDPMRPRIHFVSAPGSLFSCGHGRLGPKHAHRYVGAQHFDYS